jgi:riboflavin kinase/FMN adenylyltransferase
MKIFRKIEDFIAITSNNQKFCASIGNFDGVHIGHKKILHELHNKSLQLEQENLVITFEPHTKLFHNPQNNFLLTTTEEKIHELKNLNIIDNLLIINFDDKFKNIEADKFIQEILLNKLKINHIIIGDNFNFGKNKSGNITLLKQILGDSLSIINILDIENQPCSSTTIKNYIQNGEVEKANKLLGYNYYIYDFVCEGNKLARQLGFPTANIKNIDKILPKFGVYEVNVTLQNDMKLKAIANVGIKPTVGITTQPLLETHILNFSNDIYSQKIKIEFTRFIRNEKKFPNLDELITQIKRDIESL